MKILRLLCFSFICLVLFSSTGVAQTLNLNDEQLSWLAKHPEIRIAFDNDFPPFEWQDENGKFHGISIDYIQLLEKKLNIRFTRVEVKNWSEVLQQFKGGKIDILPAIAKNEQRQEYMLFTQPHISTPGVIISAKHYNSVQELTGKKVGVVLDYYWDDLISQYDDKIEIVRVDSTRFGVELTAMGAIDAMVTDLASISYILKQDSISNLQVVPVPLKQKQKIELAIGIRKDWPQFQEILQKTMASINQQEKDHIYNKWIKLEKTAFWQSSNFWYSVFLISLLITGLFIAVLLWNRSLKLQVARHAEQLQKAQAQLIHAEKMESIGRLSAGVAHEVKNPLAILQMSIDYLKGEDNDDTINSILDDMDDAVLRADTVIKGLLDFSREKELQVIKGNINEVIKNSLRLIEHELKQRNIKVISTLADNLPELGMDKNRLQQVFINLFMNAAQAIGHDKKSTKMNNEISVTSSVSEITDPWLIEHSDGRFTMSQKVIVIRILDSGCGLDKNDEKNVFEPFFTTKPVGEGTGLGLSVSKTIIGLHNGMIAMRNRTDNVKGAEITILFTITGDRDD